MNKVTTINLAGISFQLEEAGYDALQAYLENAAARLQGNPDRDEILSDIEQAIGEKFRAQLSGYKNVILAKEVEAVLAQMGPIEGDPGAGATAGAAPAGAAASGAQATGAVPGPKRLYRIQDGAMLAGVCNGLAAYLNVDPTLVRLAFAVLTLVWGTGLLVYIIMAIVVPQARTPEERAAATGVPPTAQDFIRRAKEGYYDAVKSFPDRQARREWKIRFKHDMRRWGASVQREATATAHDCRRNWERYWGVGPWNPGMGLALPIVSLIHGALAIIWICTLVSLLSTGTLFGVALPVGLPVWVALLVVLFGYGMIVWPLKAARRAFYYGARGAPGAPFALFCVLDAFIGVAVVGVLLWLAFHHLPQAREAMQNIPTVFHDMANAIRHWWHQ